ncbi:MAG: AtpZ/AtpI family protein [Acidobacteriota bacterium]|nr:AtpZ/AtpI family protein [Acidobacteriota bacterium]
MIKSLLDADENPPPGTKVIIEETVVSPPPTEVVSESEPDERATEAESILEIPGFDNFNDNAQNAEAENASQIFDAASGAPVFQTTAEKPLSETIPEQISEQSKFENEGLLFQSIDSPNQTDGFIPETQAETIRKSGLAYAAAITLFGAIVFLLIIGSLADFLLGTEPWGAVGGIVLGSVIGFVQFFRMTSQILKNKD